LNFYTDIIDRAMHERRLKKWSSKRCV
jgi:hypothetical protein